MRPSRGASASVTKPSRASTLSDAPAASSAAVRVSRARSGSGSPSTAPQVGPRRADRPDHARARRVAGELGQRARGGLRRVAGAGEQDGARRPTRGRVGAELRQPALDPVLQRALAGRGDAAVAERVRVAVGAGAVDHGVGVLDRLAAGRVRHEQPEPARAALGARDRLVLEQALARRRRRRACRAAAAARAPAAPRAGRAAARPARRPWAAPEPAGASGSARRIRSDTFMSHGVNRRT